ncbi:binding protein, partial [Trifolium pratense]
DVARPKQCNMEGADQFLLDVAQNPNDTEESIWCNLCKAQLFGVDEAKQGNDTLRHVIDSNTTS